MTLQEQVNNDIKEAMKAKQQERLDALRMLKAEYIKNNTAPKPTDELSVTVSHAKKIQDSLEMYEAGSAAHDKLLKELEVIRNYLPQALITEIKSRGASDMGSIMKELQPQIKGRFDGKRASELVKAAV
jgi:uncharacterized protein